MLLSKTRVLRAVEGREPAAAAGDFCPPVLPPCRAETAEYGRVGAVPPAKYDILGDMGGSRLVSMPPIIPPLADGDDGELISDDEDRGMAEEGRALPMLSRGSPPPLVAAATARPKSDADTSDRRCGAADIGLLLPDNDAKPPTLPPIVVDG